MLSWRSDLIIIIIIIGRLVTTFSLVGTEFSKIASGYIRYVISRQTIFLNNFWGGAIGSLYRHHSRSDLHVKFQKFPREHPGSSVAAWREGATPPATTLQPPYPVLWPLSAIFSPIFAHDFRPEIMLLKHGSSIENSAVSSPPPRTDNIW